MARWHRMVAGGSGEPVFLANSVRLYRANTFHEISLGQDPG